MLQHRSKAWGGAIKIRKGNHQGAIPDLSTKVEGVVRERQERVSLTYLLRPPRIFNDKLNPTQQKMVQLIVKHIENLTSIEERFFFEELKAKFLTRAKQSPIDLALTDEELKEIGSQQIETSR